MGDISTEPSMEEILSSIKRIIAEEGDPPGRARRQQARPVPPSESPPEAPEVLELNTPAPIPVAPQPAAPPPVATSPEPTYSAATASPPYTPALSAPVPPAPAASTAAPGEAMLSQQALEATRGSLDVLSRLVTKPEPGSDGTLEGLVRDMLRPMLREWLDKHLPELVEAMVAREISKITGQG